MLLPTNVFVPYFNYSFAPFGGKGNALTHLQQESCAVVVVFADWSEGEFHAPACLGAIPDAQQCT